MKRLLLVLLASLTWSGAAVAASAGLVPWDRFDTKRVTDMAALQRGAQLFANYCLNCHSAGFMRYNRLRDIGLSDQQIKDNFIFTGVKVGDLMTISMTPADAKDWFGAAPPDLTLIARSRAGFGKGANSGADYIYTFLRTYYRDETKATGWNNAAFPNVGMPFPLWELQGQQRAVFATQPDPHNAGKSTEVFKGFEMVKPGSMTEAQYNEAAADLTAFLFWMAEPAATNRVRIGVWVMLFLAVFIVIAWRLNAAYWKDIK
ncbi:MAG: cytochrome c1 [Burkholderiaceae bacterium]|jgi:ubiquinol-cytochrome c reductase cytochrome c1 subunit|nr:cytochrome c1 [Burkholderiaceae bacterium]MCZ8173866.1 cytochrome c1 [Burkholderiaceae bacterium]